jgi:osmoprotectant transport system substrate-binding protein
VKEWGLKAMLIALCLSLAAAGCGGDAPPDKSEVTLKVRPEGTPERRLVSQIYAQALRSAGFEVRRAPRAKVGSTISFNDLKAGKLSGYPEYLSRLLFASLDLEIEDIPASTQVAYRYVEEQLEKQVLTAFPPAPYSIANAIGFLRKVAARQELRTISDLKGKAEKMTIGAPSYCNISTECLTGIEEHYNTAFELVVFEPSSTIELTWWRPEPDYRYEVLENGVTDASILYNTDGRLSREGNKFVILEDDKHILPASNFVWVTSEEVVEEAGPDYEKAIMEAQKGLTLPVIRRLNAEMEEGKSPAKVAAKYLRSVGI